MFEKTKKVVESMSKPQNLHKTCGNHKNQVKLCWTCCTC